MSETLGEYELTVPARLTGTNLEVGVLVTEYRRETGKQGFHFRQTGSGWSDMTSVTRALAMQWAIEKFRLFESSRESRMAPARNGSKGGKIGAKRLSEISSQDQVEADLWFEKVIVALKPEDRRPGRDGLARKARSLVALDPNEDAKDKDRLKKLLSPARAREFLKGLNAPSG